MPQKIVFLALFLLYFGVTQATEKKIDSLYKVKNNEYRLKGELLKAIHYNEILIKASLKINYKQGIFKGYLLNAELYCNLDQYDLSFKELKISETYLESIDDPYLLSGYYTEYGEVLKYYCLYSKSMHYLNTGNHFAEKIKDKKARSKKISLINTYKIDIFETRKEYDSMMYYLQMNHVLYKTPQNSARIGTFYLENMKNIDSADHYIRESENLLHIDPSPSSKAYLYLQKAKLLFCKKNYDSSIVYCNDALRLWEKLKRKESIRETYALLKQNYRNTNDWQHYNLYSNKYLIINDSIHTNFKNTVDDVLETIVNDEDRKMSENSYVVMALFLLACLVLFYILYHNKTAKNKIEKINEKLIENQNILTHRKLEINQSLVEMIKTNNPLYFKTFQDHYPDFISNLLQEYPNLTKSDLYLTTYIFLDMSSKDISKYIFLETKTIYMKKYRLRKKMFLTAEQDLYIFIQKFY
ncbi:hypothetical protein B0A69_21715 [Chryseobacterium shigense]|uniref:Tetratricopeptide repeat-containing protein n=1 Tax=Chryseobacterium shigense TaxID=297244 RepID=A0A1N7JKR4_9FLAO|nr:hypothetical protein [Chryseobacterium shigense]PQA89903.1 hypothetical protein B0A69_21715 [Chryseobacterium shigense]SIS49900.1 hypothetical protein SAMN05421639_10718 [Chryseobacterium shigense]